MPPSDLSQRLIEAFGAQYADATFGWSEDRGVRWINCPSCGVRQKRSEDGTSCCWAEFWKRYPMIREADDAAQKQETEWHDRRRQERDVERAATEAEKDKRARRRRVFDVIRGGLSTLALFVPIFVGVYLSFAM